MPGAASPACGAASLWGALALGAWLPGALRTQSLRERSPWGHTAPCHHLGLFPLAAPNLFPFSRLFRAFAWALPSALNTLI